MRVRHGTATTVLATLTAAGTADASTLVHVCGRDLCTSDDRARDRERLNRDGARDATQFDAAISPDGRRVAWVGTRINVTFCASDYRRYVAGVRNLRHPSAPPNRRFVVATAHAPPGDHDLSIDHPGAIVLFNSATGAAVRGLTRGPRDSGPVFPPDGRSVAFERSGGIWRIPVAGGRARRVVRSGRQPAWDR